MLYWILSALLWATWDILYKKSIWLADWKISDKYYQFIWNFFMTIFLPIIYVFFEWESFNLYIFILIFLSAILSIIWELFEQYWYRNEKISVLVPFWEFQSIFTIILWFFVFSDNSTISLVFALLAWFTLVVWWLDFKKFRFNKYCLAVTTGALLWSIKYIIYWLLLVQISEYSILYYNIVVSFFILLIIILLTKELKQYEKIDKQLTKYILLENFTRLLVSFITLFLIKELWLVQAVLIWMLYLIASLIFSYLFLKNIPSKKELLIVFFVFLFVTLWSIFW